MEALKKLYNGILNDYSIQRYSLGWSDVVESIEKRYKKPIERTDEVFENELLCNAISTTKGNMKSQLEAFAKELKINIKTIYSKSKVLA